MHVWGMQINRLKSVLIDGGTFYALWFRSMQYLHLICHCNSTPRTDLPLNGLFHFRLLRVFRSFLFVACVCVFAQTHTHQLESHLKCTFDFCGINSGGDRSLFIFLFKWRGCLLLVHADQTGIELCVCVLKWVCKWKLNDQCSFQKAKSKKNMSGKYF